MGFFFFFLELSKLEWSSVEKHSWGFRWNFDGRGRGEAPPGKVYVASAFPTPISKIPLHPCAWTYHHEELTSGVSQVKSRGSQSQIPPRGAFILTPLRPHQVRLRVRAPCVPRAEALSAGSASSRLPAPRRAPAPRSRLRRVARLADKVSNHQQGER